MLPDSPLWAEIQDQVSPKRSRLVRTKVKHKYVKKKRAKRQAKPVFTPYVEPNVWRSMVRIVETSDGLVHYFYKAIKSGD